MKKFLLLLIVQLGVILTIGAQEKVANSYKTKIISQESAEAQDVPADEENSSESPLAARGGGTVTGSTYGELSVSLTGAAQYNVPIDVPPGLNGVEPEVSLTYNSQSGNGLAGWGWNVSGISVITRIPTTLYHDDEIDPVDFDLNDRFALDGQRLILKSGIYGGNGTVYQTESYSNIKITSHGTHPLSSTGVKGPAYFMVRYPDGSYAKYESVSYTDYAITYWENPQGVRISYEYTSEGNGFLINRIKYGSRGVSVAVNEIKFNYVSRGRSEQAYIGGEEFRRTSLLSNIEVKGKGSVLYRKYFLAYDKSSLGYNRLKSIREMSSSSTYRSPITFDYGNTATSSPSSLVGEGDSELGTLNLEQRNAEVVSGDFSGNGKMDFLLYPTNGVTAKKKFWLFTDIQHGSNNAYTPIDTGDRFTNIFPMSYLIGGGKVAEHQGIGIIQEISGNRTRFRVYNKNAGVVEIQYEKIWDAPTYYEINECAPASDPDGGVRRYRLPQKYISGDFDGDGLTDIISISKSYTRRSCYIRRDEPVRPKPICDCESATYNYAATRLVSLNRNLNINSATKNLGNLNYSLEGTDQIQAFDANGDGKTDILQFREGKVYVYGLSSDNSNIELLWTTTSGYIKMEMPLIFGDYNGDGKIDFMTPGSDDTNRFILFVSSGKNFEIQAPPGNVAYTMPFKYIPTNWDGNDSVLYGYNLIPSDVNGDGKTDIIEYNTETYNSSSNGKQTLNVYYSQGMDPGRFEKAIGPITKQGYLKHFPIPVFMSTNKSNENLDFAAFSNKWFTSYTFSKDHRKDVELEKVSNKGVVTTIRYAPVNSKYVGGRGVYIGDDDEAYPFVNVNVAPSFKVVAELSQTGSGKERTKYFNYQGAVSHATGLGFLGFKRVVRSSWQGTNVENLYNVSDYDPHKNGAVTDEWVSKTASPEGNSLSHTTYDYDYKLIANPSSPASPQYESDISIDYPIPGLRKDEASNSITLLPGFYANGNNGTYIARVVPPEDQPGASGYAGVSDLTLKKTTSENVLTGVTTTEIYTYDDYKNVTKAYTTFPGGSKTINYKYSNNPSVNNTSYHIGRVLNKTERTVLGGSSMTLEEAFTYEGNLVKTMKKRGNGTDWLTEIFTYDIYGNVKSKQLSGGGANRIEEFEYASTYGGRFLTKSTDVEGLSTSYTYDAVTGNPHTTTNPYGLTTTFTYDVWDRLTGEKNYLNKTTTHVYLPQTGGGMKVTTNYPEGAKEEVIYNAFGWKTRSGALSLNGHWVYKSFVYDVLGRKVKVSEPYTGGASQWNETLFDQYGRVIDQNLFNGKNIGITYNGLSSTINDGTKTVTTMMDALGNRVKVTDPGGTVNYTYYPNGVMKTANYDGHEVSVQIDGWGRKIKLTDPAAGTYTYEYDILGQLLKETTPKGATDYTYNSVGKMLTKKITGDHTNMSLTYNYNGTTKLISSITGVNNTDTETYNYTYSYDSYKRPSAIKEVNSAANFEKRMSYDGYGRINTETFISKNLGEGTSSTIVTKNIYDPSSGLLEEIRDNASAAVLWKVNEINARGQALDITLGNGMTQTTTYDAYGYVDKAVDQKQNSTNTIVALNLDYNFNVQRGTLTNRKNNKFSWNENFGYDNLDRLKTISGSVSKTMCFDNRGRITKNTDIGDYAYESNNLYRLKEITPNTKSSAYYEQHPTQQISYNAFKKPVEITEEGHGRASFEYSPMLNRSHAYYGGAQTNKEERRYHKHYSAIIPAEIVEDTQTGSTKIITYIAGDAYSAPIAHIKKTGSGAVNEFHYLHRDYLGSIMAITDASGNLKEQRQFGAWGTVDKYWSSAGATVFTHNSLLGRGYTGHEHFFEVGLIHMNGRMYDANMSRFLSPDNFIQNPYNTQNFNRYGYVLNNPLLYTDPSGEFIFESIALFTIVKAIFVASAVVGAYALIANLSDASGGSESTQNIGPTPSNSSNSSEIASSGIRGVKIEGLNVEVPYGVAPWHRYKIDSQGRVTYYDNKGGDEVDYLMSENGSEISVNDTTILPSLMFENSEGAALALTSEQSKADIFNIFMFGAHNTNIEWKAGKLKSNNYFIANMQSDGYAPGWEKMNISENMVSSYLHSHPKGFGYIDKGFSNFESEKVSMGYKWLLDRGPRGYTEGDWTMYQSSYGRMGKYAPKSYVYFPDSGRLWRVGFYQPYYIRNINNDYNRFFFGPF